MMGSTAFYLLPFPDPTSSVDVPRDVKALADALELWKTGHKVTRTIGADTYVLTMTNDATGGMGNLSLTKNAVEINRLIIGVDGTLSTYSSGIQRPLPFSMWCGIGAVTLSNATGGAGTAVNIPAGRFTQSPLITMQVTGGSTYIAYASAASLTSVTPAIRHVDNVPTTGTFSVHIHAIQMTPTSSAG
jgi:hypothetical protein